jgi:hypothetical protein
MDCFPNPLGRFLNGDTMKEISLTRGKVAIVDEEDFDLLNVRHWRVINFEKSNTYAATVINKKIVFMHRLLMKNNDTMLVDHINGNGLDNRKTNLRYCTHSQNMRNRKLSYNSSTGFKGVHNCSNGRYRVQITFNNKRISIGRFDDILFAAKAYDDTARKLFGEFAKLNFTE